MSSKALFLLIGLALAIGICLPLAYSVTTIGTTFSDGTSHGNLSIIQNQNTVKYFSIPKYSYINTLLVYLSNPFPNICQQEYANQSSACGGKSTGIYYAACYDGNVYATCESNATNGYGNAIDGDYSTYAARTGNTTILQIWTNFTKPNGSTGAVYNFLFSDLTPTFSFQNWTIPQACWDALPNILNIVVYTTISSNQGQIGCYDGTSPILYSSGVFSNPRFFEDSIIWNYTAPINITVAIGNYTTFQTGNNPLTNITLSNASTINTILNQSCNCFGCSISGTNCLVPFSINSTINTTIGYSNIVINASYGMDLCTNSFNIPSNATMINYSGRYEINDSTTNISITTGSYITWALHGDSTTSTIYPTLAGINKLPVCGYPNWAQFDVSYLMNYNEYNSLASRQRSDTGMLISNILTTIPLYVISTDTSGTIRIRVTDLFSNPIQGATVTASRLIAGVPFTVQTGTSDSAGMVYLFLDTLQTYTITASKTGYTTSTNTIQPTTVDIYTLQLGTESTTTQPQSAGVNTLILPPSGTLQNNTVYLFSFNLTSTYWTITDCDFSLINQGTTVSTVAGTFNSSLCSAYISLNTSGYDNLTGQGSYSLNGTANSVYSYWIITGYSSGNYTFKTVIDDINNFTGAGFGWQTKMLFAFLITVIITGIVSYRFNSLINPEVSLILQCALVLVFSIIGWMTIPNIGGLSLNNTAWGVPSKQYAIFMLDLLITGGYVVWRHS